MVFATDALAITCRGSSLWRSMPEAEKQRLIAAANRQPFAQGRYFRIEKGGRTSYILGTIHVPPIKQLKLPGFVMEQLRKSSHVYLEKSEKEFSAFTAMLKANSGYVRATGLNGLF